MELVLKPNRQYLTAALALLGIFFLTISFFSLKSNSPTTNLIRVATLIHETGKIEVIRAGLTQRSKVETRTDLNNFDSVETFEIGEATLIFENGFHVRVFENSLLTLEKVNDPENEHVVVVIKRGDIRIDKKGRANELVIAKGGERVDALAYDDSPTHQRAAAAAETNPALREDEHVASNASTNPSLTDEEISGTMNNHRSSFLKCYAHLAQKNPHIKGESTLTFTIENSGKPTMLSIASQLSPKVPDDEFNRCLKEVVQRITFKPFSGPQVSTIFPLKFD